MSVLENKIPPPVVALVFALAMWWISSISPIIDISFILRIVTSMVILTAGLFFCIAGVVSFRHAKTTVNPLKPHAASSLVVSGVYRISRNPMYVGFALFLISLAVFLSSPFSIIGVIVFVLYMNKFQIKPEEKALRKIFSTDFTVYILKIRRWL